MKNRDIFLWAFIIVIAVPVLAWAQGKAKGEPGGTTLKVKLNYTGAGLVDEKHKLYVVLFDSNPFAAKTLVDRTASSAQAPDPAKEGGEGVCSIIARQGAPGNRKAFTMPNLRVPVVYALAFFDKSGTYPSQPEPSSGSPMGTYGIKPETPEPIRLEAGKAAKIELTFDDSRTTP